MGKLEEHTFAAFIAGRKLLSLPYDHIVRQSVLVMEDAVKTGLRDFLVSAVAVFPGHTMPPAALRFQVRLKALDVLEWSHSWPYTWRFGSDFRIIKISQNMF